MTNHYKISFYVVLILLIIGAVYYYYTKPDYTELIRPQEEQAQINISEIIINAKDSLSKLYNDSLQESRNNIKVITKTVYKEQEQLIKEPVTSERIEKTLNSFSDFYDLKVREIGIDPSPEIKLPEVNLTQKQFKGAELVLSELDLQKSVNTELKNQNRYYEKQIELKDGIIVEKNNIIGLKEKQLVKLENTKIPVVSGRKWYVDAGIIIGSLAIGFTTGIVYKNLEK